MNVPPNRSAQPGEHLATPFGVFVWDGSPMMEFLERCREAWLKAQDMGQAGAPRTARGSPVGVQLPAAPSKPDEMCGVHTFVRLRDCEVHRHVCSWLDGECIAGGHTSPG